ncbi:hypothetical protein AJ79_09667 [Helicocarpus griseus UAMH5409]|uniref:Uncharacterized protein n=1 Tax=Helicocarpus griseus UAMH5409 TaxID=1447875 RepID=A0A2B7WI78_9EURO|nr:hypothetical protein AJ79_09667 [Helicocarpus griseus UAMH5409]
MVSRNSHYRTESSSKASTFFNSPEDSPEKFPNPPRTTVLLHTYDGRDWPYAVTLNTVISILVTMMKAALVVPLAEGISQLKWSWFNKPSRLYDLALLDAASRGPLGAGKVIFQFAPCHLMSLGCLAIMIATVIGPFAQQVVGIKTGSVSTLENTSSIPICDSTTYNDIVPGRGPGLNRVPVSTMAAIYNGIYENQINSSVAPKCSSGNCTFPKYQSLGVCSQCADLTADIVVRGDCGSEKSTKDCIYTLPKNIDLQLSVGDRGALNTSVGLDLLRLNNESLPVIQTFTAMSAPLRDPDKEVHERRAVECILYFCFATYEAEVHAGQLNERIVSTSALSNISSNPFDMKDVLISRERCLANGNETSPSNAQDKCNYVVNGESMQAIRNTLTPLVIGNGTSVRSYMPNWSSDIMEAIHGSSGNYADINAVFISLASTLTTSVVFFAGRVKKKASVPETIGLRVRSLTKNPKQRACGFLSAGMFFFRVRSGLGAQVPETIGLTGPGFN